jgi:hypothetical protein
MQAGIRFRFLDADYEICCANEILFKGYLGNEY